jgi:hypothetical protein
MSAVLDKGGELVRESSTALTPMGMLQVAVQRGATLDELRQLMDLEDRWRKTEAHKAFVVALNAFKANPPEVLKSAAVAFGQTSYKHAALDKASEIIGAALAKHDLSHRWNVEQADGKIKVTCILTHCLGHSESVAMEATPDTSGSKNSIQAIGSTVSYLQRYTLFSASGIAPKNVDDDGRGGGKAGQMDEKVKLAHLEAVAKAADSKALEALWAMIASECTKAGDVPAYEELKAAVRDRAKALKKAPI